MSLFKQTPEGFDPSYEYDRDGTARRLGREPIVVQPQLVVETSPVQFREVLASTKPVAEKKPEQKRNALSQITGETARSLNRDYNSYLNAIAEGAKFAWEKAIYPVGKFMVKGSAWLFMNTPFVGDLARYVGKKAEQLVKYWPNVPWPIRWAVGGSVIAFGVLSTVIPMIPGSILYLGPLGMVIATADPRWFKWSKDKIVQGFNWITGKKDTQDVKLATA